MADPAPLPETRCSAAAKAGRLPHAVLDLPSRRFKGMKIERLLNLAHCAQPIRMLEVGTGSGGIAHYFGTHTELLCDVDAVDVRDNRVVTEGYRFHLVADTQLPFPNEAFDVVLSNHVIEHVGDEQAQRAHLAELRRVLRTDGVGYLAVPNRWMLVEPHYQLVFLSWLPRPLRSHYLRLTGRGNHYDCEPLTLPETERLLGESGFVGINVCVEALRLTLGIEGFVIPGSALAACLPDNVFRLFSRLMPTLIYRLSTGKASAESVMNVTGPGLEN